jgi:DNA helicase-2/ATP-dependent DNA helicase PcrA
MQLYRPQVLRYDKNAKTYGYEAVNFGLAKGLEYDRVLIVPTGPIKKYLQTGDLSHVTQSRERLHVAVTRAFDSVAFVFNEYSPIVPNRWKP